MELEIIARMESPLTEKFGIPRQSGLAESLKGRIVLEGPYADERAVKGLEDFDYIWVIWGFEGTGSGFRPQVRPPRLGGNEYMGVFATRSPYRPNPIGLSCMRLESVEIVDGKPVLNVSGSDLRDGTPIYDIKPYLPYAEAHPGARGGFTDSTKDYRLRVVFGDNIAYDAGVTESGLGENGADCEEFNYPAEFTDDDIEAVTELLSQDPRPAYHDDPERIYGMKYKDKDVRFRVDGGTVIVTEIV